MSGQEYEIIRVHTDAYQGQGGAGCVSAACR